MSERHPRGPDALEDARKYCAALAREHARDQWFGGLYARTGARDALFALASFDYEIRRAATRARDPNLAAIRLSWWRGVVHGERDDEAAGSQVALALGWAIEAFAMPRELIETMIDARLQELAPQEDFSLDAFDSFSDEAEGARLRLAARIAAGGRDLDEAEASAPAAQALALTRMLAALPFRAGAAPTLFPADVAARHSATIQDFDGRRANPGVVAACAELRGLARERLATAERRLKTSAPAILPAFIPLGALRLDLDRLERNASRPFDPAAEPSLLGRQWAIWRWARGR